MKDSRQFSLRSIFQITAVLSLVFTLVAPLVRAAFTTNKGPNHFLIFGFLQVVIFGLVTLRTWTKRNTLRRLHGKPIYRTSIYSHQAMKDVTFRDKAYLVTAIAYGVVWTAPQFSRLLTGVDPNLVFALYFHPLSWLLLYAFFTGAARSCLSLVFDLDQHTVEIYEAGFCYNIFQFVSWNEIKEVRAHKHRQDRIELIYGDGSVQGDATKTISVVPVSRDELVTQMAKRVAATNAKRPPRPISTAQFSKTQFRYQVRS